MKSSLWCAVNFDVQKYGTVDWYDIAIEITKFWRESKCEETERKKLDIAFRIAVFSLKKLERESVIILAICSMLRIYQIAMKYQSTFYSSLLRAGWFTYWVIECGNLVSAGRARQVCSVGSRSVRILVRVLAGGERAGWAGERELRPADYLRGLEVELLFPIVSEDAVLADHEGIQDRHYKHSSYAGDPYDDPNRHPGTETVRRRSTDIRRSCRENHTPRVFRARLPHAT